MIRIQEADTYDTEVIYQVYPASFMDTNGDGVGDLAGILAKLDYIQSLHVDAVWISPFFLSPAGHEGDGGYAVENYREIDPRFGTMADFDALLTRAHELGLKIYTDFVLPHTSNRHEWFRKSERREAGFEDFYIWHDGKIDDPIVGEGAGEGPREGGGSTSRTAHKLAFYFWRIGMGMACGAAAILPASFFICSTRT